MSDRFKFRIPMFTDKGSFMEFQYIELGEQEECTLCGYNGEPQQCTGLKDKNGKLIYEGDIVRFKDCNDILIINYQKEMACFAPQFYCNGEYGGRLWFDDYDSSECQFYKSNNFEVIGNIYENKSLLKSEDK